MKHIIIEDPEVVAFIPIAQYATVEDTETYREIFKRLDKQLKKCPKIGKTRRMKEHPAIFHFFFDTTDIYISEYDGLDTVLGFAIINGDLQKTEYQYYSLMRLTGYVPMNIDYYFEEGQTIEAILYRKFPGHFKKPPSLEKQREPSGTAPGYSRSPTDKATGAHLKKNPPGNRAGQVSQTS